MLSRRTLNYSLNILFVKIRDDFNVLADASVFQQVGILDVNSFKGITAIKSIITNISHGIRNDQLCQILAVRESISADSGHSIRDIDADKPSAPTKSICANLL